MYTYFLLHFTYLSFLLHLFLYYNFYVWDVHSEVTSLRMSTVKKSDSKMQCKRKERNLTFVMLIHYFTVLLSSEI